MSEPAKDEAVLLERMAKGAMCDGIIICHNQKSCLGCFAKADATLAAIRAAGWAVVPQTVRDEVSALIASTYSHVDGRDLLGELHPRKTLDIKRRVDGVEIWYQGDWLSDVMHYRDRLMLAAAPGVKP
jgi:hypothetical protein